MNIPESAQRKRNAEVVILTGSNNELNAFMKELSAAIVTVWNNEGLIGNPNCILCALAVNKVLQSYGYSARPTVVYLRGSDCVRAVDIGQPDGREWSGSMNGHLVVEVRHFGSRYIVDSSISQAKRSYTPSTPAFAVTPISAKRSHYFIKRKHWQLASFGKSSGNEVFAYYRTDKSSKFWRRAPDAQTGRVHYLAKKVINMIEKSRHDAENCENIEAQMAIDRSEEFVAHKPFPQEGNA